MATCGANAGTVFDGLSLTGTLSFLAVSYLGLKIGWSLIRTLYSSLLASPLDLSKWKGGWAVVTGATDGIGKAYAKAMAKKGLNIVLISRTQAKLDSVAKELEAFGVNVKTIAVDFVQDEARQYKLLIASEIEGLDIYVLVNNVGMSYSMPAKFLEMEGGTDIQCDNLVKCNIESVNSMTSLILPQMKERGQGAVINLSSLSAGSACPLLTVYSATKAYVDFFTRGLTLEYEPHGLTIQCVMPGYVVSNMSKIRRANFMAPMPDQFVKSALAKLGVESRTTGYWVHDIMLFGQTRLLPTWIAEGVTLKQLASVRMRALKKREKNTKEKKSE